MANGALSDIHVVELSEDVAGPYACKLLAGLGAEVIKVERPGTGDSSRQRGPFLADRPDLETSAPFLYLNTGKKSVSLDLWLPEGRGQLLALLERADILVESYGPGGLEQRGIDPADLRRRYPRLIQLRISDFGQHGPYSDFRGGEIVVQALGGLLFLTGDPEKPPVKVGGRQAYYLAGLNAFVALMSALLGRDASGDGSLIDCSVHECVVGALETATHRNAARGEIATRDGNWANRAAWGIYPCADGHVAVVSGDGLMFRRLGDLVPELCDPRFDSYEERRTDADLINAHLLGWLAGRTREEIYAAGQAARLPFGPVLTVGELLDEPQLRARTFFEQICHPIAGNLIYPRAPFRLSEAPWQSGRAPLLGEHTAEAVGGRGSGRTETLDVICRRFLASVPAFLRSLAPARNNERAGGTARRVPADTRPPIPDPLGGVRVLDLTMVWAGPFAAKLLADAGAEVLKIESLQHVDSRLWAGFAYKDADPENPPYARDGYVILFSRNKLGMTLDLASAAGRSLFLRLVAISDVVLENFAAGVMERLGFSFETLRAVNPRIVLARMPAFGSEGPEAHKIAYGTTLEAIAGLAGITGYRAGEPHKSGINYGDPVAGLHAAGAVLAALHRVRRGGGAELIEVAQLESLVMTLGEALLEHSLTGCSPGPLGNADPNVVPQGIYPCAGEDRWIALTVTSDGEWQRLVDAMDRPDWALDPVLRTNEGRRRQAEAIDRELAAWTRSEEQMELMARLQAAGVRAGAVLDVAQILADPHLKARGLFTWIEHPDGVAYPLTLNPWLRDGERDLVRRLAPALGEHNGYAFSELLGLGPGEIADLEARRLIGRLPILDDSAAAGMGTGGG